MRWMRESVCVCECVIHVDEGRRKKQCVVGNRRMEDKNDLVSMSSLLSPSVIKCQ